MLKKFFCSFLSVVFFTTFTSSSFAQKAIILTDAQLDNIHAAGLSEGFFNSLGGGSFGTINDFVFDSGVNNGQQSGGNANVTNNQNITFINVFPGSTQPEPTSSPAPSANQGGSSQNIATSDLGVPASGGVTDPIASIFTSPTQSDVNVPTNNTTPTSQTTQPATSNTTTSPSLLSDVSSIGNIINNPSDTSGAPTTSQNNLTDTPNLVPTPSNPINQLPVLPQINDVVPSPTQTIQPDNPNSSINTSSQVTMDDVQNLIASGALPLADAAGNPFDVNNPPEPNNIIGTNPAGNATANDIAGNPTQNNIVQPVNTQPNTQPTVTDTAVPTQQATNTPPVNVAPTQTNQPTVTDTTVPVQQATNTPPVNTAPVQTTPTQTTPTVTDTSVPTNTSIQPIDNTPTPQATITDTPTVNTTTPPANNVGLQTPDINNVSQQTTSDAGIANNLVNNPADVINDTLGSNSPLPDSLPTTVDDIANNPATDISGTDVNTNPINTDLPTNNGTGGTGGSSNIIDVGTPGQLDAFGLAPGEGFSIPTDSIGLNGGSVNVVNVSDQSQQYQQSLVSINAAGSIVPVTINIVVNINSQIQNLQNTNTLDLTNFNNFGFQQ